MTQAFDIAAKIADLHRLERLLLDTVAVAQERLLATRVEIALLTGAEGQARPVAPPAAATPGPIVVGPRLRGRGARLMIEALNRAGDKGLSGSQVSALFKDASLSTDTSEKVRAALKRVGAVGHDAPAQRWYAPGTGPAHVERERMDRVKRNAGSDDEGGTAVT